MEKFYSFKTLLKMAGGNEYAAYLTFPLGSAPGCIITIDGLKFKRDVLNQTYRRQSRRDRCKEVKEMLSDDTDKTIFKC